jgi:hypothetical protein
LALFRGWVPTITGNLSFSTIGIGRSPKKLFKKFKALDCNHYTVVVQKRRTTDALLGWFGDFLNWCSRTQGHTIYIFFGSSSEEDGYTNITGPCIELPKKRFQTLKCRLTALNGDLTDEDFEQKFLEALRAFSEAADDGAGVLSSIKLARNGAVDIEVSTSSGTIVEQKLLASQVYFFLRDICHLHQHHAPTSDTILDVTDCSHEPDAWKRETLYSLYRWVIQQKRAKRVGAFLSAKGVLAYAHTFEKIHCIEGSILDRKYFREATVESIQAGLESADHISLHKNQLSNAIFTKIIPLFALFLAAVTPLYSAQLNQTSSTEQQIVAQFADLFNQHLISVLFYTFIIFTVYNLAVVYGPRISTRSISLDLLRLAFVFPFWFVALCMTVLALCFLGSAVALFYLHFIPSIPISPTTSIH